MNHPNVKRCGVAAVILAAAVAVGATLTAPVKGSTWASRSGVLAIEGNDDLSIFYNVMVTEPFIRLDEAATITRMTSTMLQLRKRGLTIGNPHRLQGVDPGSSDAFEVSVGDVNVHSADNIASLVLGLELPKLEPDYLPTYRVLISPADGLTWADIDERDDIQVTLAPLEQRERK